MGPNGLIRSSRLRVNESDPNASKGIRRLEQDLQSWVGHIHQRPDDERQQRCEPPVGEHRVDRGAVTAEDDPIEPGCLGHEDPDRIVGGGAQRYPRMTLAPAGDPLLRLPAGRRPAVHLPAADLRADELAAHEDTRRVPAEPDEKNPDTSYDEAVLDQ
ncbi:MAG: hypothetical protein JWO88_1867 [Frankiales bacterium]|nr:hypothetical protein [Frankiales bacterium]